MEILSRSRGGNARDLDLAGLRKKRRFLLKNVRIERCGFFESSDE